MHIHIMMVRIRLAPPTLFLVIARMVIVVVQAQVDDPSETYPDDLEYFQISTTANAVSSLTCNELGARCLFRKDDYAGYDLGGGQETANELGAVWAYTTAGTVLTLQACIGSNDTNNSNNDCIVMCTDNCTCSVVSDVDEGGDDVDSAGSATACTQVTSRAPTVAPLTNPQVAEEVCTIIQFEQYCGPLMLTLPPGIAQNYDCFTFCGGVWASSCSFGQTCDNAFADCANATAVGTLNGPVAGCTNAHLTAAKANMTNSDTDNNDSIAPAPSEEAVSNGEPTAAPMVDDGGTASTESPALANSSLAETPSNNASETATTATAPSTSGDVVDGASTSNNRTGDDEAAPTNGGSSTSGGTSSASSTMVAKSSLHSDMIASTIAMSVIVWMWL